MRFYIFADYSGVNATDPLTGKPSYDWQLIHAPENFYGDVYGSPIEQDKAYAYNISMDKEMNRAGSLSFTIGPDHPLYRYLFPLGTTIIVKVDCQYDSVHDTYTDGHVIWFGRILTIERNFNLEKNITCEGALAFLNDIMIRPRKFFAISTGLPYNMGALDVFQMCYNDYNYSASAKRKIAIVNVVTNMKQSLGVTTTVLYTGATTNPIDVLIDPEDPTGPTQSYYCHTGDIFTYDNNMYVYETDADEQNGEWSAYTVNPGYISQTTYTEISDYVTTFDKINEIANLDPSVGVWCECTDDEDYELTLYLAYLPWRENPSKILFAQNLTEFTDNGDGQDIYNVLIPFGANKIKLNETTATQRDDYIERVQNTSEGWMYDMPKKGTDCLVASSGTGRYGYIEKTIDFSDIDDSSVLHDYAALNLAAYVNRDGKSFSIGAVELSLLSQNRNSGYNELLLTDMIDADYNPNNFINIGDGVYFKSTPHGILYGRDKFTCTSLKMDIDNPGATNYTFEIYDSNYIPLQPKLLTSYLDKKRAIAEGKIATDGTIYYANRQGTTVYKESDNKVVERDADHEVVYEATGTGDVRSDITSTDMAYGTNQIPNSSS